MPGELTQANIEQSLNENTSLLTLHPTIYNDNTHKFINDFISTPHKNGRDHLLDLQRVLRSLSWASMLAYQHQDSVSVGEAELKNVDIYYHSGNYSEYSHLYNVQLAYAARKVHLARSAKLLLQHTYTQDKKTSTDITTDELAEIFKTIDHELIADIKYSSTLDDTKQIKYFKRYATHLNQKISGLLKWKSKHTAQQLECAVHMRTWLDAPNHVISISEQDNDKRLVQVDSPVTQQAHLIDEFWSSLLDNPDDTPEWFSSRADWQQELIKAQVAKIYREADGRFYVENEFVNNNTSSEGYQVNQISNDVNFLYHNPPPELGIPLPGYYHHTSFCLEKEGGAYRLTEFSELDYSSSNNPEQEIEYYSNTPRMDSNAIAKLTDDDSQNPTPFLLPMLLQNIDLTSPASIDHRMLFALCKSNLANYLGRLIQYVGTIENDAKANIIKTLQDVIRLLNADEISNYDQTSLAFMFQDPKQREFWEEQSQEFYEHYTRIIHKFIYLSKQTDTSLVQLHKTSDGANYFYFLNMLQTPIFLHGELNEKRAVLSNLDHFLTLPHQAHYDNEHSLANHSLHNNHLLQQSYPGLLLADDYSQTNNKLLNTQRITRFLKPRNILPYIIVGSALSTGLGLLMCDLFMHNLLINNPVLVPSLILALTVIIVSAVVVLTSMLCSPLQERSYKKQLTDTMENDPDDLLEETAIVLNKVSAVVNGDSMTALSGFGLFASRARRSATVSPDDFDVYTQTQDEGHELGIRSPTYGIARSPNYPRVSPGNQPGRRRYEELETQANENDRNRRCTVM